MQDVRSRLMEYLDKMGISQARFANRVGVSRGYVNSMTGNITQETSDKIKTAYPNLNMDWLVTGRGEMFNNTQAIDNNNLTNSTIQQGNYINNLAVISKIHDDFQNIIDKKDEQINELLSIIKQLTNK